MTFNIKSYFKRLFITLIVLSFGMKGFAQNTGITLNIKKQPLASVLKLIEQQTSYNIIYNTNKIKTDSPVTISVTNSTLDNTLKQLLKNTSITYAVKDKQVLLIEKKASLNNASPQQNERLIKGKVYSASDNFPLAGATIIIQGSRKGAITNFEGEFKYLVKGQNIDKIVLEVSYLGMETSTQVIGNKSEFIFYLNESTDQLDEVIITSSYGTKKLKQEVVGSIATVDPKNIAIEQPAVTFDELLEGQIAGVFIEVNPQLGEPVGINIRGQGSLTRLSNNIVGTSTQPLIIVDGIILSEETGLDGNNFFDVGEGNLSENILNPLARVGVEDIESFNVLKDAAAVGLYGADAANGVIIITTKSGKKGKTRFNATIQSGVSTAFNGLKFLSGEQYQTVLNEYNRNNGDLNNIQPWNGVNTDWQSLLNKTGRFNRYNFGVSGGSEHWGFRANVGYQINDEAQIENTYKKINTSLSADYRSDKINIGIRVSPSLAIKNDPNKLYAFALPPTIPAFDENGDYTPFQTFGNPLAVAKQNLSESKTFAVLGSIKLDYYIFNNLKFSTLFGMDFSNKDEDKFFSGLNGSGQFNDGTIGRRFLRDRDTKRWNWNASLFYENKFNEVHAFDALVAIETRQEIVDFGYARGNGFSNFTEPQPIEIAEKQDYQRDSSENAGRSVFSQLNYNYKQKYFFLANFRIDQSSAFGSDNNTALNGGLGASWNISNEDFLSNSNLVDFLRLRISYGTTGNSRIGSYRALGLYTILDNGYNGQVYGNLTSAPNPNLGWETNKKFNVGIDFNFLDRFSITTDFFRDNIIDQIVSRNVILETGFNSAEINGAEMYNQGIEFSINANWLKNEDFSWNSSFNITKIQNKVTSLTGLGSDFSAAENARSQTIGFPTSAFWGYNFIGIDPATGRELFDIGGEIYDAATVASEFDASYWTPIGDSQPEFFGGMRNTFKYKNFNLNIIMSYSYGADILVDRTIFDNYRVMTNRNINANIIDDAWFNQGDNAIYPIISNSNRIISNSTKYLFDSSHIKLKSVSLSYSLPVQKYRLPLKSLSFNLNGANLHYWFKNKSPNGKNGIAEFRNTYPEMRTFTIGVNTTF